MYRSLSILFSFLLFAISVNAQNTCEYQLILNDSGGDGWQGSGVNFFIETMSTSATINGTTDTINISVTDGDSISIEYISAGVDDGQNNVQLLDSDGQVLLDNSNLSSEVIFEGFVICPSCPAIVLNSVVNVDSFDNRILIDWEPSDSLGIYQIEYARCGFLNNPDSVSVVMSSISEATIPDLMENTCYEYQISLVCLSGSQSIASGPHRGNTIFSVDVGISGAFAPQFGDKCTFSSEDTLFVFLKNFGAVPQTFVPFDFTISSSLTNSGGMVSMPEDGLFTGILVKDSCVAFPFEETIDISEPGEYTITAFTSLEGDGDISNDTFTYVFSHSRLLPFFERFDDNQLPDRWNSDEGIPVIAGTITSELDPLNSRFTLTTDNYGRISATDSLEFDYSFTDLMDSSMPASLTLGDQLIVEATRDCGENYETLTVIDMNNFDASFPSLRQVNLSLEAYVDEIISFRFTALRGGSSFRTLLDDINVYECNNTTNPIIIDSLVINTSEESEENGSITVSPNGGVGPYTFDWSTGFTEIGDVSTLENIGRGMFSVTITDNIDASCFISETFNIGVVSTNNLADITDLKVYPNPVSETLNVDISLEESQALDIKIFNVMGQQMWSNSLDASQEHFIPISVNNFNQGIYFIQLSSELGQITEKFVVEQY